MDNLILENQGHLDFFCETFTGQSFQAMRGGWLQLRYHWALLELRHHLRALALYRRFYTGGYNNMY